MHILYIYINLILHEFFFNPAVFVKGKLILGFCNLAAMWLETQAAQERARKSARIFAYFSEGVLFIRRHASDTAISGYVHETSRS